MVALVRICKSRGTYIEKNPRFYIKTPMFMFVSDEKRNPSMFLFRQTAKEESSEENDARIHEFH
jgi:hypothetical protein